MIGAALGLGFVVGPPPGGRVADAHGVRPLGFVVAGLRALSLPGALPLPPETRRADDVGAAAPPVSGMAIVRASSALERLFAVCPVFITGFGTLTVAGARLRVDRFGLGERAAAPPFAPSWRASHAHVQRLGPGSARAGVPAIALVIARIEAELAWLDGPWARPRGAAVPWPPPLAGCYGPTPATGAAPSPEARSGGGRPWHDRRR